MTDKIRKSIEDYFIQRCKTQHIKPKSKAYYREQASFFAGVMTGLLTANVIIELDPIWTISCITNRDIVKYTL